MMNNRVLMVSTVPSMIGQFNMENIQILKEMGYSVDVAADFSDTSVWPEERVLHLKKKLDEMSVECVQLTFSRNPLDFSTHLKSLIALINLLSRKRYSFIHTHTPIASALVRCAALLTNTPVIYTAHGFHFYKGAPLINWVLYYPIEKVLSRYTNCIITINQEDYCLAKTNFKNTKVVYIPGIGIDTTRFFPNVDNRELIRKKIGIGNKELMLLSVGELSERKNHLSVLKALELLSDSAIHYVVVGKGNLEHQLFDYASKNGIKLHLLGFRNDINDLCNACDLFVFPSFQEGLPVALMEALSTGTRCICSNIRGNIDLIADDFKLFDPHDIRDIASCIERNINDDRVSSIDFDSVNLIRNSFSKQNVAELMVNIYRTIK